MDTGTSTVCIMVTAVGYHTNGLGLEILDAVSPEINLHSTGLRFQNMCVCVCVCGSM